MGNIYTGSNSGKAGLNVKKTDNTVDVFGVSQIQLGNNMTLLNNGNGSVTINSTGGGSGGSGVTELSFGSTGLTPAVATTGSITVAGTLEVGSGGTGLNSLGSANEFLKVDSGATALEYSEGLTYVSTAGSRQLKIVDTGVDDMLVVESTDSDATNAPDVKLFRNSSSPVMDDLIGVIKFNANDTNGDEQNYARIEGRTDYVIPNAYGGSLDFYVINDATEIRMVTISGESIGAPNAMFHVNPDGVIDGDFQHSGSGGLINIFSDAQNRQLEFTSIRKYEGVTPAAGKVMMGNGSFLKLGDLTSTGGSITITNDAGPSINLETTIAGYESWIVKDGGGFTTNIDSGDTLEIAGGTGITTTLSGTGTTTPTLTIDVDGTSPTGSGVANQVTYWDGANSITGDAGLQWNPTGGSERLTLTGSSEADMLRIVSTNTGTGTAPDIAFVRDRTYQAGLDLGIVLFKGPDADDAEHTYAFIQADAKDGTVGAEKGQIDFRVGDGTGGNGFPLRLSDTGAHFNVVNASGLDVRMDTASTDNAFRLDASADTLTFGVDVLPFNIQQQSTGTAGLTITIDDDGATASPDIKLFHNSTSPAANDDLGHLHFQGKNSAAATTSYADFFADILDPTDTVEAGRFNFRVRTNTNSGNLTDMLSIRGDGNPAVVVNDSGRADVDFRVETDSQTNAFLMDASADTATFNVPLTVTNYTLPTADGNAGEVITTDGNGNLSFAAGGGGGTPAGSNKEIQFNDNGSFGADSGLTYDSSTSPKMLQLGSENPIAAEQPVAFTQFCFDASDPTSRGGSIFSTDGGIGMSLTSFGSFDELSGFRLDDRRHQFDVGKTTTFSFGQTQNSIENLGSGQIIDCYPSQGGLIVFTGSSAPGGTTDTINLVLAQVPASVPGAAGSYNPMASPYLTPQPPPFDPTPPPRVPNVNGYGTWQVGDQVTVLAALDPGLTPNITIRSYNSEAEGSLTPVSAPTDASATGTPINGVNSSTAGGGQQTITTNFTAKTFILIEDRSSTLGVQWVCIG